MIETKVPMDIRTYKTRQLGPFTTRQIVCVCIAVILDAAVYFLIIRPFLTLSIQAFIYLFIILDVPVLAFCIEVQGMPMEVYLRDVLFRALFAPAKRKTSCILLDRKPETLSKKEQKAVQKKLKKARKRNRNFVPYR